MRNKRDNINGEIALVRQPLPRTNLPFTLQEKPEWIKQSNLITFMRYDYSVLQLRTLICVLQKIQSQIEDVIKGKSFEQLSLFQEIQDKGKITLMIKYSELGVKPYQYKEVKAMLKEMATISVELDTKDPISGEKCWSVKGLLTPYLRENPYSKFFTIEIDQDIVKVFLNMEMGFTKFLKNIAFKSQKSYTIRLYLLISSWKDKGGFSIKVENFRKMFCIENKYPRFADLYRRVIRPAYENLHEKADCWFEVAEIYKETSDKEPYKLNFKVINSYLIANETRALENGKLQLSQMLDRYLMLTPEQSKKIMDMLTVDNISLAIQKSLDIISFIKSNQETIKKPNEYFEVAMSNFLAQPEIQVEHPLAEKNKVFNLRK